jgi:hypothetical protein
MMGRPGTRTDSLRELFFFARVSCIGSILKVLYRSGLCRPACDEDGWAFRRSEPATGRLSPSPQPPTRRSLRLSGHCRGHWTASGFKSGNARAAPGLPVRSRPVACRRNLRTSSSTSTEVEPTVPLPLRPAARCRGRPPPGESPRRQRRGSRTPSQTRLVPDCHGRRLRLSRDRRFAPALLYSGSIIPHTYHVI